MNHQSIQRITRFSIALSVLLSLCACTPSGPPGGGSANLTQVAMTVQAAMHTPGPAGGLVPLDPDQPSQSQPVAPGNTQALDPNAPASDSSPPTKVPTKQSSQNQSQQNQSQGSNQGSSKLSIGNLGSYPENTVFYGFCNAGELTQLGVHATIDPLDQISDATLKYRFVDPNGTAFDGSEQMWLLGVGDYEGVIDAGIEAPLTLVDQDGSLEYWVEAKDKNNALTKSGTMQVNVKFCQGSVAAKPPDPGANPNASNPGEVKFKNNSSHPISSLIIDNQEVILSEPQTIVQGGWLIVYGLGPGEHFYSASYGIWQGGSQQIYMPLPVESFNGAPNEVIITDPSIYDLLTNNANQGAFVGPILDGTGDFAGFCFYSNGSFDFYLNGQWADNGTYSLDSRQPGVYSVKFTVINQHGTEQFVGTYYYAGAFAGLMQMANSGRPGFENIEYKRDSHCP